MDGELKPKFNQLSFVDRTKLYSVTLGTSLSGLAREDTQENPLRFPFYAVYLGVMALPLPMHAPVSLAICGFIWSEMTPWSRWAKGRIRADFTHEALIEKHKAFIVLDAANDSEYIVRNRLLLGHAAKIMWSDTTAAARSFRDYIR